MTTLHISHTVRDFDEWLATFESFADFRVRAGVTGLTVRRGVDDPNLVAVDLELGSADAARALLASLQTDVWPSSPHVDGTPTALVLERAPVHA
jgi:hypothetical protein